jgi:hypothetical protein
MLSPTNGKLNIFLHRRRLVVLQSTVIASTELAYFFTQYPHTLF